MKKKYWFKPKRYGYGFVPITWEGWLAALGFVILIILMAIVNRIFEANASIKEGGHFLVDLLILAGFFTIAFRKKVEGGLGWRWGNKKK